MFTMSRILIVLALFPISLLAAPVELLHPILHLRSGTTPEWVEFATAKPQGRELKLAFVSQSNREPCTLRLFQDDVKLDWPVEINGRRVGSLFLMEAPLVHSLTLPPGTLRDGDNELFIRPPRDNDDIRVGRIQLITAAAPEEQSWLDVTVTDAASRERIPARITIVDTDGALPALSATPTTSLAVRPGVVYTATGQAKVQLAPGQYTVYATRGFAYGLGQRVIAANSGTTNPVPLEIRREVQTPGWVCSDTHVHTLTYSGHGDATVEERVITLAGEGIELPIATDHNVYTDFAPVARAKGVDRYFTPVVGNEITTPTAHFNAFPFATNSPLPDFRQPDWLVLWDAIRHTPNVQMIILNHPHNTHNKFEPFAPEHFDATLGLPRDGLKLGFDAMELVNSSALQTDLWQIFKDWFALLNAGERIVGVGSSDVHDVSRYIVGQGRTYIRCATTEPNQIDVKAACQALRAGKASVSLGLFIDMIVNEKSEMGDLATGLDDSMTVEIRVSAPSWITPDKLELFANGVLMKETALEPVAEGGVKAKVRWMLPKPRHDVHLIALASGPGVSGLYWPIARPYQPRSPIWLPRVIGCTNPIWIDADGDGQFTSARAYAKQLVQEYKSDPERLAKTVMLYDAAVAAHVAQLNKP
jgi:hypothetical protein